MRPAERSYPVWAGPLSDVALTVLAAGIGIWRELAGTTYRPLVPAPTWVYVAVQVLAGAVLLARRTHPLAVGCAVAGLSVITPTYAAFVAPYAVLAYASHRGRAAAVTIAITAGWSLGARLWDVADPISGPALIVLSAVLGLYVRERRGLYAAVLDRAERAEREQELLAEQARAEERVELAAEMHDVVTHRVNLMVLQAGALESTSTDPAVRELAADVRIAGAEALRELREVVGVLRAADTPSVGDLTLTSVVTASARAGQSVTLHEEGDARTVPPLARRALLRVTQEALTNAVKHAPGAEVVVAARYTPSRARLTVRSAAPRGSASIATTGGGAGLPGLRHRVAAVGGRFTAGPDGDGYLVEVDVPLESPEGVG